MFWDVRNDGTNYTVNIGDLQFWLNTPYDAFYGMYHTEQVPKYLLEKVSYEYSLYFTLSLTNWFGMSSIGILPVKFKQSKDTPTIAIQGQSFRSIAVTDNFDVFSVGSTSSCSSSR